MGTRAPSIGRALRELLSGPATGATAVAAAAVLALTPALAAQSLRGSHGSMDIQNRAARQHDFTFLSSTPQVRRFIDLGLLVPVRGNADYDIARVSFPYARPEVRTFIERLAGQYRQACGEQLVVTSLTRPQNRQPANASSRSVHPTGMAIDLRRSNRMACRSWLEDVLLYLEERKVLEATRERWPPHYHVAVFPRPYARYVASMASRDRVPSGTVEYQVRRGDSLWGIASRMGVSVDAIRRANDVDPDRLFPGQRLAIPVGEDRAVATDRSGTGEAREYTVRSGDSLWEIARSAGLSVVALRAANGLASSRIHPGQRIRIPAGEDAASVVSLRYRVRPGDSLWEIARAHRTTVDRIRTENDLGSSRIVAGQVLEVPVGR